ncbi:uncharacterized protein AKAW2_70167A [Aspergillus luchuensis]|uniref:Uncharacterized protein n=1 Tax=Aspergillus kawachii TaxID=1069201 RepID=A0A7R8AF04_ASPKA|nr:uncharacterized protein AKAW2_70167A [Aspergillus luchuensis]BCS03289.1 hypothetical protein AKAW2_70167A [Aspergillus luchuensis]BCS14920.1 hypothetical protein ALUC_70153A [Aspergillus luchuensis]
MASVCRNDGLGRVEALFRDHPSLSLPFLSSHFRCRLTTLNWSDVLCFLSYFPAGFPTFSLFIQYTFLLPPSSSSLLPFPLFLSLFDSPLIPNNSLGYTYSGN